MFLFSILGQKDQAMAESIAIEQAEVAFSLIGTVVRSAETIEIVSEGKDLRIVGRDECWLFSFDEVFQELRWGKSEGTECVTPSSAEELLSSKKANIERVNFSLLAPDDSSRTVKMEMDILVVRPLWSANQSFSRLFVNLIDDLGDGDD